MSAGRIEQAMARINAALERIEAARDAVENSANPSDSATSSESGGSARITALVNAHEKLREDVADTIGQIDSLIEELEQ